MRPILGIIVLVTVIGWTAPTLADAELLLADGTVLRGVEVRLEGGLYLLELDSGEVAAIPAALVRELRLLDVRMTAEGTTVGVASDVARPASQQDPLSRFLETRPGWRRGAPQDVAGAPWRIHDTQRQTAVFGPPARFQPGLPFRFKPFHAWDRSIDVLAGNRSTWSRPILDPVWRPRSAFDPGIDVLAASRSTWPSAPRPTSWNPSNSFSRVRADLWWGKDPIPGGDRSSRSKTHARLDWQRVIGDCTWCTGGRNQPAVFTVPTPQPVTAEQCARRLFADAEDPGSLQWAEIETTSWDTLPPGIHRAWTAAETRAVFSIAGGACRLIAGDLRELIGIDVTETDALTFAVSAWNQIQPTTPAPVLVTPTQQIDHAVALVRLFETATSGHARARIELLENRAAVERWLGSGTACSKSLAFRRTQRANVDRNFTAPRADPRLDWTAVTFWTWSSRDGEVFAYDVRLFPDGRVSVSRESIGEHLGEHEDSR